MKFQRGFIGRCDRPLGTVETIYMQRWPVFYKRHHHLTKTFFFKPTTYRVGNLMCSIKHIPISSVISPKRPDPILWWDHIDLLVRNPNHYRIMKLYCNAFVKIPQMITIFKGMLQWSMASCEHTVHMQTPKLVAFQVRSIEHQAHTIQMWAWCWHILPSDKLPDQIPKSYYRLSTLFHIFPLLVLTSNAAFYKSQTCVSVIKYGSKEGT